MPQYELNLRDYLRIFRKRKFTILAIFLISAAIAVFTVGTSKESIVYHSSITIKIEQAKTIAGLLTEWIAFNPANVMDSELRAIKGFPVMQNVALRLNNITAKSTAEEINNAISRLQGCVDTEKIGDTNMIRIITTTATSREAVELANMVVQACIEENIKDKSRQATQTRQFIEEQLVGLEDRLKNTENSLRNYRQVAKNIKFSEPNQQKLEDMETQLAELLQKYTDKHPKVIELRDRIKEMEGQMKGFSSEEIEYSRLSRELEINKKLYGTFKERLEESKINEAQKVSDISVVEPAVNASATMPRDNRIKIIIGALLGLILGVAVAFISETLDTSIGTIEDVEKVIKLPVLGVVPSIEYENKTKKRILSVLGDRLLNRPKSDEEIRLCRLIAHYKPQSPISEAYRNIYTNLKIGPDKKAILVTSSGPQEGKSSVVCNLGVVIGQLGLKVVLVSADLRRPVLAKTFGIKKEPGLSEFFMGTAGLESVLKNITDIMLGEMKFEEVRKTPGLENISIITSGYIPNNPVELLESRQLVSLIETLKSKFDVVIFDAPPVLPVTDASILAPLLDSTILVYEIGKTSREALMRTKVQLESAGAKISGIVLNHTRPQSEAISSYPYYYHYKYRYYKNEEGQAARSKETPGKHIST